MKIQLVLTDDWELRGDGSGNMRVIQFQQMQKLVDLYERYGIKGTFNVEVMQQLYHYKFGAQYPELLILAHEWEENVKQTFRRGHDVQLHIHIQWLNAQYENGKWKLSKDWNITNYPETIARQVIRECKTYLENLLQSVDPSYRCVSFRSGAWCAAPSDFLMQVLIDEGIIYDASITEGLVYNFEHCKLDYRKLDESFLPYYPDIRDARYMSDVPQRIFCVPTHSFAEGFLTKILIRVYGLFSHFFPSLRVYVHPPSSTPIPGSGVNNSYSDKLWGAKPASLSVLSRISRYCSSKFYTADLAQYPYLMMCLMLKSIRKLSKKSGWKAVPIILENHTKDIGDFSPLEKFFALLSRSNNIEVITARQLANNLKNNIYPIKVRQSGPRKHKK